jgi:hypothetical protein
MSILRSALILALIFDLAACDPGRKESLRPADPDLPVVQAELVTFPSLADPSCSVANASADALMTIGMNLWSGGHLQNKTMNVSGLSIKGGPLSSPAVAEVLYGTEFRRACDSRVGAPPQCGQSHGHDGVWYERSRGAALSICGSAPHPPRFSIEAMSLNAVAAITQSALRVQALLPAGTSVSKVTVLASPKFSSRWTPWRHQGADAAYETLFADNLAYFAPTSSTPPLIAILPDSRGVDASPHLWESSFVAAHEYGHHIAYSLGYLRSTGGQPLMETAAGEAFADLIAYASQNLSDDALNGIPCLGSDRSPGSEYFGGGILKAFTAAIASRAAETHPTYTVLDDTARSAARGNHCSGTPPHTAHGLGAIFARTLLRLAAQTPGAQSDPVETVTSVSIQWLKNISSVTWGGTGQTGVTADARKVASAMVRAVEARFKIRDRSMDAETMSALNQIMRRAFPAFGDETWFQD